MIAIIYLEVFILLVICSIPFIKDKKFKLYDPVHLSSFIYFFTFGIPAIYMIHNPMYFVDKYYLNDTSIAKAMIYINLTYLFYMIGFYLPEIDKNLKNLFVSILKKLPRISNYQVEIKNLPLIAIIIMLICWGTRFFLIKSGYYIFAEAGTSYSEKISGYNLFSYYLFVFSTYAPSLLILLFYLQWLKNKTPSYLIIYVFLFTVEILFNIPSGSKEQVFTPIFYFLITTSFKKKISPFAIIIPTVFFVFFIIPYTGIFRLIYNGRFFDSLCEALEIYSSSFLGGGGKSLDQVIYYILGDRLNYTAIVVNIIENTPRIWDFSWGYSYLIILTTFIPRFIWQNKPEIGKLGNEFALDYNYNDISYLGSAAMTWVGEMFLNFGWFGFLVGLIFGLLFKFIYMYFVNKKMNDLSLIFYVFTLYSMIRLEGGAAQISSMIKSNLILLVLLFPFIKRIR